MMGLFNILKGEKAQGHPVFVVISSIYMNALRGGEGETDLVDPLVDKLLSS